MWKKLNDCGREERTLELLFRIGVAGCFVGHGAFGVMGKEAWLPYFAVAGIGENLARTLMPMVGAVDVLLGIMVLLAPRPIFLGYAAGWAVLTALLRPFAGESIFETLERAGNYGVPIAFLLLVGTRLRPTMDWLHGVQVRPMPSERRRNVMIVLRATTVTLLAGHGGLALLGKPLLATHIHAVGLPEASLALVGVFEVALAAAVAIRPAGALLVFVLAWKLGTEALYPASGAPFWEFVERAGSYVAPLALWTVVRSPSLAAPLAARVGPALTALRAAGARLATYLVLPCLLTTALLTAPSVADAMMSAGRSAALARPFGRVQNASLLTRLQGGGFILACRHAITDRSRGDARRVDFSDRSTQRVLSAAGEAQARRLGESLRSKRIPIGDVLTSPYSRTADSAELTFGRAEVNEALYGDNPRKRQALRRLFTSEPPPGANRVLMTHQGTLYRAIPRVERGSIREGDCVVVAPDGESFEVITRLGPEEWAALSDEASEQQTEAHRAIAAARQGGTVIVCRHAITGSYREREPVDYADSTTQRLLSRKGERQSRRLGAAITAFGIQISDLVASPMNRARRTAELMFDRSVRIDADWHTNGGDYAGEARRARRQTLRAAVPDGNRLIVSHIGTMSSVLDIERRVGEGDCVVVRPGGVDYAIIGVVRSSEWDVWR